jgi:hypothetical protein
MNRLRQFVGVFLAVLAATFGQAQITERGRLTMWPLLPGPWI